MYLSVFNENYLRQTNYFLSKLFSNNINLSKRVEVWVYFHFGYKQVVTTRKLDVSVTWSVTNTIFMVIKILLWNIMLNIMSCARILIMILVWEKHVKRLLLQIKGIKIQNMSSILLDKYFICWRPKWFLK